jgi:hypothetical protein
MLMLLIGINRVLALDSSVGVFRSSAGKWYLDRNADGQWSSCGTEGCHEFGTNGDLPVVGDWTGDGVSKIGVFRPSSGKWYLDLNGNGQWDGCTVDGCYVFGAAGDLPVAGDWDGDGVTQIGVFRPSAGKWYLDLNGNGNWDGCTIDECSTFGMNGDIPVAGDWDGNGVTEIGVFRPITGKWYIDLNGNGQWDGCGVDECYTFGTAGDVPVAGDWNNDGLGEIGVFRPSTGKWYFDLNSNGQWEGCDLDGCYTFGMVGDLPIAGRWSHVRLTYHLQIDDPANRKITVRATLENIVQNTIIFSRPPNSFSLVPPIEYLSVVNGEGVGLDYTVTVADPTVNQKDKIAIDMKGDGKLVLEYRINLELITGSPYWILNETYGIVESQFLFLQPIYMVVDDVRINFNLPDGWSAFSRYEASQNNMIIDQHDFIIDNADFDAHFFIWGPIAFGKFDFFNRIIDNVNVRVGFWQGAYRFSPIYSYVANGIFSIIDYGQNRLGRQLTERADSSLLYIYTPPFDSPPYFLSARDHILGDFRTIGDDSTDINAYAKNKMREIAHTVYHTFFSHFDLNLWDTVFADFTFQEGLIQYCALKTLEKTNIWDQVRVNMELVGWHNDYINYIWNTIYDVPYVPEAGYMYFPNTSIIGSYYTYGIKNIIAYEKAPLIFWLIDSKLKDVTGGSKDFLDVCRYLHDNNPGNRINMICYVSN